MLFLLIIVKLIIRVDLIIPVEYEADVVRKDGKEINDIHEFSNKSQLQFNVKVEYYNCLEMVYPINRMEKKSLN